MISHPQILNSDQGSQLTSGEFTEKLEKAEIQISRDGRGRVFDNIFIERLWRTVKYEEVDIHSYDTVRETRESLTRYFKFYTTVSGFTKSWIELPQEVYSGLRKFLNKQVGTFHLKEVFVFVFTLVHLDMSNTILIILEIQWLLNRSLSIDLANMVPIETSPPILIKVF